MLTIVPVCPGPDKGDPPPPRHDGNPSAGRSAVLLRRWRMTPVAENSSVLISVFFIAAMRFPAVDLAARYHYDKERRADL